MQECSLRGVERLDLQRNFDAQECADSLRRRMDANCVSAYSGVDGHIRKLCGCS